MVDFWHNHFNVHAFDDGIVTVAAPHYDRTVIRPNVFGNFRRLVEDVASHPAMLQYFRNSLPVVWMFRRRWLRPDCWPTNECHPQSEILMIDGQFHPRETPNVRPNSVISLAALDYSLHLRRPRDLYFAGVVVCFGGRLASIFHNAPAFRPWQASARSVGAGFIFPGLPAWVFDFQTHR